jgi:signal transduction histidine kinase
MRRRKSAAGGGAKTRGRKATRPTRGHAPARARRRSISATELQEQLDRRIRELNEALAQQAATSEENMRLLNELRQSLQQQTATADVLKIISRSTFDLQTVLDTLVESAARLCEADSSTIHRPKGDAYPFVASYGYSREYALYLRDNPIVPGRGSVLGRAVLDRKIVHVADVQADPDYSLVAQMRFGEYRTVLGVPLMREGSPIGVIMLTRNMVRPFTDKQIELVTTFADQAVIAIENVRLFDEVQARSRELGESLQQQTATADVLKIISRSTFDLQTVLDTLIETAARLCEARRGVIFRRDGDSYHGVAFYNASPELVDFIRHHPITPGRHTITARVALERRTVHVADLQADAEYRYALRDVDPIRTELGVPMFRGDDIVGIVILYKLEVQPFADKQIELVTTFADQAVIAIENVRLFDEIQDKSRQLAEASRHKSQFLANMSHELRTPLNAILGYTELIIDNIYGDTPEKMRGVLKRIERNGKHLLGLINDVLDLSKIEAGQLTLSLAEYSLKDVVQTVYTAVEPLAAAKKLRFKIEVSPELPSGHGDEHRLTQVLLNLVGNAIKFTDSGEVLIKAAAADGAFSVAVHDTGPGISTADQGKLFQEFQQADSSITRKKGGTGLGLAISKQIIEMHGGNIRVDSLPGQGSIFSFTLPITAQRQASPT